MSAIEEVVESSSSVQLVKITYKTAELVDWCVRMETGCDLHTFSEVLARSYFNRIKKRVEGIIPPSVLQSIL